MSKKEKSSWGMVGIGHRGTDNVRWLRKRGSRSTGHRSSHGPMEPRGVGLTGEGGMREGEERATGDIANLKFIRVETFREVELGWSLKKEAKLWEEDRGPGGEKKGVCLGGRKFSDEGGRNQEDSLGEVGNANS